MVYAVLPVGHPVYLESVRDETAIDSERIIAYGKTIIPPGKKPVRVAYQWGAFWSLEPAPWEPDALPKQRYLPSRFRLPAHFDYEMFKSPTNAPTWDTQPAAIKN
jgi:hypothetical protein